MDELYQLYHIRRALQALAAFTGDIDFADAAALADTLASLLWHARRLGR